MKTSLSWSISRSSVVYAPIVGYDWIPNPPYVSKYPKQLNVKIALQLQASYNQKHSFSQNIPDANLYFVQILRHILFIYSFHNSIVHSQHYFEQIPTYNVFGRVEDDKYVCVYQNVSTYIMNSHTNSTHLSSRYKLNYKTIQNCNCFI